MKNILRFTAFILILLTLAPVAFAAKATPTPQPIEIAPTLVSPPAEISDMLDIAYALKKQNARRIYTYATYTIFTNGLESFDKAYADGVIDGVFGTNLTYLRPELADRPWFHRVDVSKYIAYFVAALNHNISVSEIIDPHEKIKALLEKNKK